MTSQRTILMDAVGVQWQLEHDSVTRIHINRPQVDARALVPTPVAHPDTCGHARGQECTSPPPKGQTPSSQACRRPNPRNSENMLGRKEQALNSKAKSLELRAKMLTFSATSWGFQDPTLKFKVEALKFEVKIQRGFGKS